MAGIEIRIPETWKVESRVTPILAGVDDKTDRSSETGKRLVLQGTVIMGSVEIKN
jgi:hypothetical protein